MSDAIRSRVNLILGQADISFSAIYRGEKKNPFGDEKPHPMDKWDCAFTAGDGRPAHEEFDYYTGLGHRVDTAQTKLARVALKGCNRNSIAWRDQVLSKMKPQAPHAADVLHCLIQDSSALGQSFDSWCDEYGYDSDSRKAFATYEACQKNADKLRRVIPRDVLAALETALQDY